MWQNEIIDLKFNLNRKVLIILIIAIPIFLSPGFSLAIEADVWDMIEEGQHEKALEILEAADIEEDLDLRFARALIWSWRGQEDKALEELYNLREMAPGRMDVEEHLIRVLGWQSRFAEAEELGEEILQEDERDSVVALLAVQAELQQNWKLARERWQRAADITENEERREDYLDSSRRAAEKMEPVSRANLEASYSREDSAQYSVGLRAERWLRPGLTGSLGMSFEEIGQDTLKSVISASALLRSPVLPSGLVLGGGFAYRPHHNRERELTLGGGYEFSENQILGAQLRAASHPRDTVYELTPEYTYRFEDFSVTLANTLRRDDDITSDFSQELQFYFPEKSLRPRITVLRYFDDSYQLRLRINLTSD